MVMMGQLSATAVRNAGELLLQAAARHPESGVYYFSRDNSTGPRQSSYPELLDRALRILRGLQRRGVRPRDNVMLLVDEAEAFLPSFWACLLGGFVPCPLPPAAGSHQHVHELLGRPLLVTTGRLATELPDVPGLSVATVESLSNQRPATDLHDAERDDLALLMLTSGSTGQAKAVMLTHGNLLASMPAKNGVHRLTPSDTVLNWVGFDHVAALLECHLLPVSTGSSQLHVPPSVILDEPLDFLRLISRHQVTMTFTPNFLLGLINSAADRIRAEDALDLSGLRQIISGGEAVPCATGTTFLATFARYGLRRDALWPAFGMTETCAGSIYSREFPAVDTRQEFAGVGRPVADLDVRIEAGEVQLRGPMVTPGYYRNEPATRSAFTADGWFRTGDIGRLDNGRLTLVGRSKDNIIVNGVNYFSHEIETALEQLDDVTPSYVAAFPTRPPGSETEQLVVAFHPRTDPGDDAALYRAMTAVRGSVVMHCGFRPALVLPLPREEFVKNSLGKISRAKLRSRLEAGEFEDVTRRSVELIRRQLGDYVPPGTTKERALVQIYGEVLDVAPSAVSVTANFLDLGGTSLDLLRLRGSITGRLAVPDLQTIDLLTAPTVRALAAYLDDDPAGRIKTDDDYDPIVGLQQGGTKTPLFCVHPGAGEVLVLLDLAKHFAGDRPFHALRARGFTGGETPFTSHHEMIGCYTRAIQDRQPHGPYALAGYSSGGIIAFAIARELQSRGEQVAFLSGFDFPPILKPLLTGLDFSVTVSVLSHFLGLLDEGQSRTLPGKLRGLPVPQQLRTVLDLAPRRRLSELDLDLEKFTVWMTLADKLKKIRAEYEPNGMVQTMTIFHGTTPPPLPVFNDVPAPQAEQKWLDHLHEWDRFTARPARFIEVPGAHHTLTAPPHVGVFQALLRQEIDRCLGDRG
jgi:acyl-CoA synthetase (AMP-forming)/AMP-acid ligase II/thioesterase domain-containing protein